MPAFVPVVVEAEPPASVTAPAKPKRRQRAARQPIGGIKLKIDGVAVRVGSGTNAKTIAAVIQVTCCPFPGPF